MVKQVKPISLYHYREAIWFLRANERFDIRMTRFTHTPNRPYFEYWRAIAGEEIGPYLLPHGTAIKAVVYKELMEGHMIS